jgi:cysteine sulfinate desulfinase/cysteine desulfurase-like protein
MTKRIEALQLRRSVITKCTCAVLISVGYEKALQEAAEDTEEKINEIHKLMKEMIDNINTMSNEPSPKPDNAGRPPRPPYSEMNLRKRQEQLNKNLNNKLQELQAK